MEIHSFAALKKGASLEPYTYVSHETKPWEVGIEITHCGICHSDIHLLDDDWGLSHFPLVPGHEIVGIVKEIGKEISHLQKGDRVGVGWQCSSCLNCRWCSMGEEQVCQEIKATCVDQYGGYADYIRTDGRFAFPIPKSMASEIAAPLLCGGVTVFTPLKRFQMGPNKKVGVIGIGGLGHLALQFARAFGCEVVALSSSLEKESEAKKLGAHHFLYTKDKQQLKKHFDSFDLLLSTAIAGLDWELFLSLLHPFGTLCFLGGLEKECQITIANLVERSKMICGSNIGSRPTLREMLEFAALFKIAPQIELFPLSKVNEAIKKLRKNQIRYRGVLKR